MVLLIAWLRTSLNKVPIVANFQHLLGQKEKSQQHQEKDLLYKRDASNNNQVSVFHRKVALMKEWVISIALIQ
jgi:hypothetical protein